MDDAAVIGWHRAAMFRDMGKIGESEVAIMREASVGWVEPLLRDGSYVGFVVEDGRGVVAGGGMWVRERGPSPGCLRVGQWAHILNVYTEPEHRGRGLARRVMRSILDWCTENRMDRVTLDASGDARPLYESLGFSTAWEHMRL